VADATSGILQRVSNVRFGTYAAKMLDSWVVLSQKSTVQPTQTTGALAGITQECCSG